MEQTEHAVSEYANSPKQQRLTVAIAALLPLLLVASVCDAQTAAARIILSEPTALVDGSEFELHRVVAGGSFADGGFAVADGGNHRILIFAPDGRLARTVGRRGGAPSEFSSITAFAVIDDTLLVYDRQQAKVVVLLRDGKTIRTVSLANVGGRVVTLIAFQSPSRYVVAGRVLYGADVATGFFSDSTDVGAMDGTSASLRPIARVEWRRVFHHRSEGGTTTFDTPFIGETVAVATRDLVALVPLGSDRVRLFGSGSSVEGSGVPLKIADRLVDASVVRRYRESLLASMRRSAYRIPAQEERVQDAFGSSFPVPQRGATVSAARVVGSFVMFEEFQSPNARSRLWHLFDPVRRVKTATLELPLNETVIGGSNGQILLLSRDPDGVESVVRRSFRH